MALAAALLLKTARRILDVGVGPGASVEASGPFLIGLKMAASADHQRGFVDAFMDWAIATVGWILP